MPQPSFTSHKAIKVCARQGEGWTQPLAGGPLAVPTCSFQGGEEDIQPPNKGRSSTTVMLRATHIPRGSRSHFAHFPWTQKAGWGGFPGRSPRCQHGGGVSLTDHNTASSFLFLFSVLLAKQHNVYTSGYYICQNNYGMTNGTSM